MSVGIVTDSEWGRLCHALGRPDLARDPRFATADARRAHDDEVAAELTALLAARPAAEWEALGLSERVGRVRCFFFFPGFGTAMLPISLPGGPSIGLSVKDPYLTKPFGRELFSQVSLSFILALNLTC